MSNVEGAQEAWRALIDQNPDCREYYKQLLRLKNVDIDFPTPENYHIAVSFLEELSSRSPRAATPRRLVLAITPGKFLLIPPFNFI